jgi:hypothetical protein
MLLVTAAVFLLSPAQFPWYYSWVLVLLAAGARPSLLLLGVLLPIYYLRFYFGYREDAGVFHHQVVWFEWTPVFLLMAWELVSRRFPFFRRGEGTDVS